MSDFLCAETVQACTGACIAVILGRLIYRTSLQIVPTAHSTLSSWPPPATCFGSRSTGYFGIFKFPVGIHGRGRVSLFRVQARTLSNKRFSTLPCHCATLNNFRLWILSPHQTQCDFVFPLEVCCVYGYEQVIWDQAVAAHSATKAWQLSEPLGAARFVRNRTSDRGRDKCSLLEIRATLLPNQGSK